MFRDGPCNLFHYAVIFKNSADGLAMGSTLVDQASTFLWIVVIPPTLAVIALVISLAVSGKSFGLRELYVGTLIRIFEVCSFPTLPILFYRFQLVLTLTSVYHQFISDPFFSGEPPRLKHMLSMRMILTLALTSTWIIQ